MVVVVGGERRKRQGWEGNTRWKVCIVEEWVGGLKWKRKVAKVLVSFSPPRLPPTLYTYFIELYDFPSLPIKSFANLLWAAYKFNLLRGGGSSSPAGW